MGAFAEWLNIRPWEMDQLSAAEFEALVQYLEAKTQE